MILTGELNAGSRLPIERDLAARLSVSRGPLREGVRALCTMGILTTRQGDGTYVTSLDPGLLMEPMSFLVEMQGGRGSGHIQAVRRVLECEAVAQACLRISDSQLAHASEIIERMGEFLSADAPDHEQIMDADIAFHRIIAQASENPVLEGLIDALAGRTVRARLWRAIADDDAEARTHTEHLAILEALRRRDPDIARVRMASHLLEVEGFLEQRPTNEIVSPLLAPTTR